MRVDLGLSLCGKNRVTALENKVLRRIFGYKREGVRGGWIQLHNAELQNLYSSPKYYDVQI
jgi:hypothetical protein